MLQPMGSRRVKHDLVTEQQQQKCISCYSTISRKESYSLGQLRAEVSNSWAIDQYWSLTF